MDAKITKQRLNRMLSYDWLKIVGLAVGIIFFWLLIFQFSATRVMQSQRFVAINYTGNMMLSNDYNTHFSKVYTDKVFTGDVIETEVIDMPTNEAYNEVFQARIQLGEFDVVFASQQGDERTLIANEDKDAPKEYGRTYLETLLSGYRYTMYNLDLEAEDNYFAQLANYLDPYFNEAGEINEKKVEEDFRARAKRMKDKRYKKEEKIQEGIKIDIDRIQKYKNALVTFYDYLDKEYIALAEVSHTAEGEYDYDWTGTYALNLCPSTTTDTAKTAMAKLLRYSVEENKVSAENMCICFFDGEEEEVAYRFEGLVYAMDLVKTAVNAP